jgi:hypothetical protein
VGQEGTAMQLKEARKKAILDAMDYTGDAEVFCIYRIAPRQFEIHEGMVRDIDNKDLVQMIHIKLVKDGWYQKWHPEFTE